MLGLRDFAMTSGASRRCALVIVVVNASVASNFALRGAAGATSVGSATLVVMAPAQLQAASVPFTFTIGMSSFTPGSSPIWAAYQVEMAYDPDIISVSSDVPALCQPLANWGPLSAVGTVADYCYGQDTTATGILETVTAQCVAPGTTALHLVPYLDPDRLFAGTEVVDHSGLGELDLTLQDSFVTCAPAPASVGGIAQYGEPASGRPGSARWLLPRALGVGALIAGAAAVFARRLRRQS
ncbi:MAG TPA: hypothetical protein VFY79_09480 [Dehalococcoidia bacterium]|nr:hypothetical protein [Dehalococcoidia bacterium]